MLQLVVLSCIYFLFELASYLIVGLLQLFLLLYLALDYTNILEAFLLFALDFTHSALHLFIEIYAARAFSFLFLEKATAKIYIFGWKNYFIWLDIVLILILHLHLVISWHIGYEIRGQVILGDGIGGCLLKFLA